MTDPTKVRKLVCVIAYCNKVLNSVNVGGKNSQFVSFWELIQLENKKSSVKSVLQPFNPCWMRWTVFFYFLEQYPPPNFLKNLLVQVQHQHFGSWLYQFFPMGDLYLEPDRILWGPLGLGQDRYIIDLYSFHFLSSRNFSIGHHTVFSFWWEEDWNWSNSRYSATCMTYCCKQFKSENEFFMKQGLFACGSS